MQTTAVLSVIICTPIASIALTSMGPKLLNSDQEVKIIPISTQDTPRTETEENQLVVEDYEN